MILSRRHLKKDDHKYETVVIDSLTEIQHVIMANITGGKRDPQLKDWGTFSNKMRTILRQYRDLPMHVIFLALESEKDDEDKGLTRYMPSMYGKLGTEVQAFMDLVGRFSIRIKEENDKKVEERGICFTANPRFVAKDRTSKLPIFVEPNFTKILAGIGTIKTGKEDVVDTVAKEGEASQDQLKDIEHLAKELGKSVQEVYDEYSAGDTPTPAQAAQMIPLLDAELQKLGKDLDAKAA